MAYSTIIKPNTNFNPVIYSGNDVDGRAITTGFQTDWTWIKRRNGTNSHIISDIVRGATWKLDSSSNSLEVNNYDGGHLESFTSTGFTLGAGSINSGHTNATGGTYVSWNWKAGGTAVSNTDGSITSSVSANTDSGFSIVSFTGTGSVATVGHNLNAVPKMFIIKRRNSTGGWITYHSGYSAGATAYLNLNATTQYTDSGMFNNTPPTSSVFTIGTGTSTNENGGTYIAYCFADVKGFSKFGSYVGNGNADGTFVYTGFKPSFVLMKNTADAGASWQMFDNKRDVDNVANHRLFPNASSAESTDANNNIDIISNGFKMRTSNGDNNANGSTFIYMAFAENPLVANTSGGIPTTAR